MAALIGAFAVLLPGAVALAQEVRSVADVIFGKAYPLSMKPADIPADFKPVKLKVAGSGGGGFLDMMGSMMMPFMMMGGASAQNSEGSEILSLMDMSWTKGDVVRMQGKDFIVTYKWNLDLMQAMAKPAAEGGGETKPGDVVKAMELTLTLVAVDGLTSISPVGNFTKDDLLKAIEKAAQAPKEQPGAAPDEPEGAATFGAEPADDATRGLSNVKQIAVGLMMYVTDYDDVFPYAQSTKAVQYVTYPYIKNFDVWKTHNPKGSQFNFNMAIAGVSATAIPDPAETVMVYESAPRPDGRRAVAFADSHAKLVSSADWDKLKPTLSLKLKKSAKPLPLDYAKDWKPGGTGTR